MKNWRFVFISIFLLAIATFSLIYYERSVLLSESTADQECESCDSKDDSPVTGEGSGPYNCGISSANALNSFKPTVKEIIIMKNYFQGKDYCSLFIDTSKPVVKYDQARYLGTELDTIRSDGMFYEPPFPDDNPFPDNTPSALCDENQLMAGQAGLQVAKDNSKKDAENKAKEQCKCNKDLCVKEDSCKLKAESIVPATDRDHRPTFIVEVTSRDSKGKCTAATIKYIEQYNFECEGTCDAKVGSVDTETNPIF